MIDRFRCFFSYESPHPHREWLCEYENNNGGDIFLGDDSTKKIIGQWKINLLHKDGRIITLCMVFHILELSRNLISISKMSDVSVYIVFEKETYKMVQGEMVLLRGFQNGNL